ncbi:MAG: cytochrome d ubiquinol oxidase subunit II [Gammaproteobacteria bacterium]
MMLDYETLKIIWWLFIGVLLIGFAITDGFDMGVGAWIPFIGKTDEERRVLINSIGATWESNQVWLITAGGALFAAWPMVYATAFSGFYFALFLALFCLFLRPVGFDFRSKLEDPRWRRFWDWGLCIGGAGPALVFGIAFGNLLQGVPFHFDDDLRSYYTGGFFELLNPFALLCGLVSLSMLLLHGAIYLQMKTEEPIAARCRTVILPTSMVFLGLYAIAGIVLVLHVDGYRIESIGDPNSALSPLSKQVTVAKGAWLENYREFAWLWLVPLLGFGATLASAILSRRHRPGSAFIASSLAVACVIANTGLCMHPFLMPSSSNPDHSLTIWDSSSSLLTLKVMFWVTIVFLPIVIAYTSWVYRVLRGKVTVAKIREDQHTAY